MQFAKIHFFLDMAKYNFAFTKDWCHGHVLQSGQSNPTPAPLVQRSFYIDSILKER